MPVCSRACRNRRTKVDFWWPVRPKTTRHRGRRKQVVRDKQKNAEPQSDLPYRRELHSKSAQNSDQQNVKSRKGENLLVRILLVPREATTKALGSPVWQAKGDPPGQSELLLPFERKRAADLSKDPRPTKRTPKRKPVSDPGNAAE
jgi:hypothetical protein